jgi:hypothetical protein
MLGKSLWDKAENVYWSIQPISCHTFFPSSFNVLEDIKYGGKKLMYVLHTSGPEVLRLRSNRSPTVGIPVT